MYNTFRSSNDMYIYVNVTLPNFQGQSQRINIQPKEQYLNSSVCDSDLDVHQDNVDVEVSAFSAREISVREKE